MLVATSMCLGGVAAGQSDEPLDPKGAAYWTGTWVYTGGEPGAETQHPGYKEVLGITTLGEVTADDSRMAGAWIQVDDLHLAMSREPGEGEVGIVNGTARIDNDAGAWVGTFTSFGSDAGGEEWYVMEGEGAYEGLTTVFRYHGADSSFAGVIMPSGLPVAPDPVAAPTD
jgi:hypothetical protein